MTTATKNPLTDTFYDENVSPRHRLFEVYDSVIPKEVCEAAINAFDLADYTDAGSESYGEDEDDERRSRLLWLDNDHWVGGLATHFAYHANLKWNFDIIGLAELSILRYDGGGKFDWHIDAMGKELGNYEIGHGRPRERKLSVTVNLSDPNSYVGGDLQFQNDRAQVVGNASVRNQGSVTVFPSTSPHRVTELTSGTRYALVAWLIGEPLR